MGKDNQHYVPRFFLGGFSPPGHPGKVFTYSKRRAPFLNSIENLASEKDMYVPKWDAHFQLIESDAANVIRRTLESRRLPADLKDRIALDDFVTFQMFRTRGFRTWQRINFERTVRTENAITPFDPEKLRKHLRDIGIERLRRDEIVALREKLLKGDSDLGSVRTEESLMNEAIEMYLWFAPQIYAMRLALWMSASSRIFVTSDNPCALMFAPEYREGEKKGLHGNWVVLPISPELCLAWGHTVGKSQEISRAMVHQVNLHVAWQAARFVFASIESKDIAALARENIGVNAALGAEKARAAHAAPS